MPIVARINGTEVNEQAFTFGDVMKGSQNQRVSMHLVNESESQITNVEIINPTQLTLDLTDIPAIDPGADAWVSIILETSQEPGEQGGEFTIDWDDSEEPITFTVNWELLPQQTVEVPGPTVVKREVASGQPLRYNPRTGEVK